ncbi:LacI family DNA-binding transcriptional regulator [Cognaticolwellia beringensis]|uniref:DNA-binding transcriptional regulator GalS n=1 Tax=Cognaticolwellia beringensis TaxID=1967665 RepID=A0A222GAD4_9GAMM|nr:LacI family DNA-binding transcriptional regulator [Cognaticolwellia beringensis]ASP48856.1 DNA-binding transcriptional regulator GalS [Cognaticolwellia beringensis]
MSTIKDVARIAGVSIATVSRVVNNGPKVGSKTREKVSLVMKELGYTPNANARALVTQKSTTIGVVVPELTDPFFASLASGVDKIARVNNMQLLLSTAQQSAESERAAINLLIERRCQAIVLHSKKLPDAELIALCEKMPGLILIDRLIENIKDKCVWLDNEEGGKIAARHLMSLGHKEVACISSKYQIEDPTLRLKGFSQEYRRAGIEINAEHIEYGEPNQQGGEVATQRLLASGHKFSAIFVYNDAMAIGAISTLEDNGYKVPQAVSVIGFDDVLISRYSRPKLTTLHYPVEEMAQQAALLSLNKPIEHEKLNNGGYKYIPHIVKRESTSEKS